MYNYEIKKYIRKVYSFSGEEFYIPQELKNVYYKASELSLSFYSLLYMLKKDYYYNNLDGNIGIICICSEGNIITQRKYYMSQNTNKANIWLFRQSAHNTLSSLLSISLGLKVKYCTTVIDKKTKGENGLKLALGLLKTKELDYVLVFLEGKPYEKGKLLLLCRG